MAEGTRPRRARPLATPALLLASAMLAFLLAEGAARCLASAGSGKEAAEGQRYTAHDPLLGWSKIPGARVTYHRREYQVELAVNSHGLRDPERGHEPPRGTLRVLALGDSFLEGYTVPLEQTVTQVMEADLVRSGCRAEVINGGTLAYSTDQEYLFYTSEGRRYRPRLVLLFFYYNDILFNDRAAYFGRPKPVFDLGDGGLELRRQTVSARAAQRAAAAQAADEAAGQAEQEESAPAGRSVLLDWVRRRLEYGAPRLYDGLARLGVYPPHVRRVPRPELRVYRHPLPDELERAWRTTGALLLALRREVEADGARLAVAYVPSRMEVHDDAWAATLRTYTREGAWARDAVVARLRALGRDGGYAVVDLTPALRAADRGWRGRPYFETDGHWTALGHRVAAQSLAQALDLPAACPGS
jgi:hypothetical protein